MTKITDKAYLKSKLFRKSKIVPHQMLKYIITNLFKKNKYHHFPFHCWVINHQVSIIIEVPEMLECYTELSIHFYKHTFLMHMSNVMQMF